MLTAPLAQAADYFWIGDTGNWNDLSHWATSSGGGTIHASLPGSGDDVFFDVNSFTGAGQTVNVNISPQVRNISWIGANAPVFHGANSRGTTLWVHGSFTLNPSVTFTGNFVLNFAATTTGNTITSAGQNLAAISPSIYFSGNGGEWTLTDNLSAGAAGRIFLDNGTLKVNGNTVTANIFTSNTLNTRTLDLANGRFTGLSNWTVGGTGLAITGAGSTIEMNNSAQTDHVFRGGNAGYHHVVFNGAQTELYGSNSFANVTVSAGKSLKIESGTTQTLQDLVVTPSGTQRATLQSLTFGNNATISKSSGRICTDYLLVTDVHATGGAYFFAGANSTGNSNTNGWNFIACQDLTADFTYSGSCAGKAFTFTDASTGPRTTYSWNFGDPASGTANTSALQNPTHIFANAGTYTVTFTVSNAYYTETVVKTVTVAAGAVSTIAANGSTSFCQGGSVQLSKTSAGGSTFQWLRNNAAIPGANNSTYTATQAGSYVLVVSEAGGCADTSAAIAVTVTSGTATISPASSVSVCSGQSITLSANTGSGYTYQWYRNGTAITNATASQYVATLSGQYTVAVTTPANCTSTSAATTVSVVRLPSASIAITNGSTSLCDGDAVSFRADPDGYSYQWYNNGVAIQGATSRTYTTNQAGDYTVALSEGNGCTTTSAATKVTKTASHNFVSGPFVMGFEPGESMAGWQIADANNDTYTWQQNIGYAATGSASFMYSYNEDLVTPANDWLFTKCLNLKAGRQYKLEFRYAVEEARYPEKLRVMLGTAQNAAAMGTQIVNLGTITGPEAITSFGRSTQLFTVANNGSYYLGFHAYSDADKWNLYLDDIKVTELPAVYNLVKNSCVESDPIQSTGSGQWQELYLNGLLVGAINDNRNVLGTVSIEFLINDGNVRKDSQDREYFDRNWHVKAQFAFPGSSVDVRLYGLMSEFDAFKAANDGDGNDVQILQDMKITKYSGVNEDCDLSNNVFDHTAKTLLIEGIQYSSFGDFFMAQTQVNDHFSEMYFNGGNMPLPVELVSFSARRNGQNVDVLWQTASEKNNAYFEVEASDKGGEAFSAVGHVAAKAANSNSLTSYSFTDVAPKTNGVRYYRLKQVDLDGTSSYSKVVAVTFAKEAAGAVSVYPNPFANELNIQLPAQLNGSVNVKITSMTGQQVYQQAVKAETGTLNLQPEGLAKGVYILTVEGDGQVFHQRIVKE